ncbi:YheC/YheD family protein [Tumebacillus lipolyticus]|uniref:YheC/YheD family protein n=1 Tax=Tumebacillus lipolyticus TaxID=1280370 RepID=A0ABW5A1H6_9BACL
MRLAPGSKWSKHQIVSRHPSLRRYLPETRRYSKQALSEMLDRYQLVFVKPEYGGGGYRIFRVKKLNSGHYQVNMEHRSRNIATRAEVYRWIESVRRGTRFLVQRGIPLAQWNRRPVDLRATVQKNESGRWEVTGLFAKAAGRNLAVTNVIIGGKVIPLKTYLRGIGYSGKQVESQIVRIKAMAVRIARQFGSLYSNAIYGLDIGLDRSGRLWLIEVNTAPVLKVFHRTDLSKAQRRSLKLWILHRTINRAAEVHRGSWRRRWR